MVLTKEEKEKNKSLSAKLATSFIKMSTILVLGLFAFSCSNAKYKSCNSLKEPIKQEALSVDEIVYNWNNSLEKDSIPSYYGGAYISNGIVCILTTSDNQNIKEDIWNRCKTKNGILIKYCRTSKELLSEQIKKLDSLLLSNEHPEIEYSGHYLDEINNKIVISLGNVSDSNILNFRKFIMDSPDFVFDKSKELIFY